jgi:hypothetical protein
MSIRSKQVWVDCAAVVNQTVIVSAHKDVTKLFNEAVFVMSGKVEIQ